MSALEVTIIVLIAVLAIGLLLGGLYLGQHLRLRRRYGPEYRRMVHQEGPLTAERTLRERERRHAKLELRELNPQTRELYRAAWTDLQTRFVDAPEQTIGQADDLVTRLAAERGYPTDDPDEQAEQLSVDHRRTLEHYRFTHEVHLRNQRGEATTEDLREALVHYRELFADLLGEQPVRLPGSRDGRSS